MLLVNKFGIVTETWVGMLPPGKQEQAPKTISGVRSAAFGGKARVSIG
jgi:hypothetical protein